MSRDVALAPGERVLWSDRPHGVRGYLRPTDLFLLAFALFAALFFATGTLAASRAEPSIAVVGFFFPLLLFGFFFFGPRFIDLRRETDRASFTLTDRRIVLLSRKRDVELDLANLQHLELERGWMSGSVIYFGTRSMYEGWGGIYGGSPAPAIRGIPDADRVFRLISDARAQALRR